MGWIDRSRLNAVLAERLRHIRETTIDPDTGRPFSQRKLGELIGVSHGTIHNAESGRQLVQLDLLYSLAARLDLRLDEILPDVRDVLEAVDEDIDTLPQGWLGHIGAMQTDDE